MDHQKKSKDLKWEIFRMTHSWIIRIISCRNQTHSKLVMVSVLQEYLRTSSKRTIPKIKYRVTQNCHHFFILTKINPLYKSVLQADHLPKLAFLNKLLQPYPLNRQSLTTKFHLFLKISILINHLLILNLIRVIFRRLPS